MKILSVVTSRHDLMKISAICEAIEERNAAASVEELDHVLVHAGHPHHPDLSDFYFNDVNLPKPSLFLRVDPCSRSLETSRIIERFETILLQEKPDVVLVLGDSDAALACALATKKTGCSEPLIQRQFAPKLGHIAAGLRKFDRRNPKEMNRVLIDAIADFLFTTGRCANANLAGEGVPLDRIHLVGNLRIDTLLRSYPKAQQSTILSDLQLTTGKREVRPYAVLTLHRPENVEDRTVLCRIFGALLEITQQISVIFPAHPSTLKAIERADLGEFFIDHSWDGPEPWDSRVRMRLVPPLGYLDFLCLISRARMIFTDSIGIQEESIILGVPCIILRDTTERPVGVEGGTGLPAGSDPHKIVEQFRKTFRACKRKTRLPEAWDGRCARRIVQFLMEDHLRESDSALAAANFCPPRGRGGAAQNRLLEVSGR